MPRSLLSRPSFGHCLASDVVLKIDHIHAHFATHTTTCAGIAAKVIGIPFSFTAHAYDIYCTSPNLRNDTLVWKVQNAHKVFAVSEYMKNLLLQKLPIELHNRVQTIYVGIPLHVFVEDPPKPRENMLRLLCVAHFSKKKGIDVLIEACALLRDQGVSFHLQLHGDGPLKQVFADQITRFRLNANISIGGPLSQEDVARRMAWCHVFVMPCRKMKKQAIWMVFLPFLWKRWRRGVQ